MIKTTILSELYDALDFNTESLLSASDVPCPELSVEDWLDKGEWLTAAKRAGAEKLFFVGNNPVAVFAECDSDHSDKIRAFNRLWCLGRPRLLFLASPGEISVLDLALQRNILYYKTLTQNPEYSRNYLQKHHAKWPLYAN